jgi:hypothetical protein
MQISAPDSAQTTWCDSLGATEIERSLARARYAPKMNAVMANLYYLHP